MRRDEPSVYRRRVMSRSEHSTRQQQGTGAHRAVPHARRRALVPSPGRPPIDYQPHLDGLFTYCLSVLCDHDAAVAALGHALAVAERAHDRLRDARTRRPWLYALARWSCLRRLDGGHPAPTAGRTPEALAEHRRELAALAWPEAAGTTPEQREAIELAVRHQFGGPEIAAVLRISPETARALLSRAACEVERTRTALAVLDLGACPAVARLAGDDQPLLGTALRRELVRHVDACPTCRLTAERVVAPGPWPGNATPDTLAVVRAPRRALDAATARSLRVIRSGARGTRVLPHLDRRGFPLDEKDRAARRSLLRHRALTTTVVAAVVCAPSFALWAAYRHDPQSGQNPGGAPVTANDGENGGSYAYENSGDAGAVRPGPSAARTGAPSARASAPAASSSADGAAPPVGPGSPPSGGHGGAAGGHGTSRPGRITVTAAPDGDTTVITITAAGGAPVNWSAADGAPWLRLSASSGVLRPGRQATVTVTADPTAEPPGAWSARITFTPAGGVVTVRGEGPTPSPSASATPTPTDSASAPVAARRRTARH